MTFPHRLTSVYVCGNGYLSRVGLTWWAPVVRISMGGVVGEVFVHF